VGTNAGAIGDGQHGQGDVAEGSQSCNNISSKQDEMKETVVVTLERFEELVLTEQRCKMLEKHLQIKERIDASKRAISTK